MSRVSSLTTGRDSQTKVCSQAKTFHPVKQGATPSQLSVCTPDADALAHPVDKATQTLRCLYTPTEFGGCQSLAKPHTSIHRQNARRTQHCGVCTLDYMHKRTTLPAVYTLRTAVCIRATLLQRPDQSEVHVLTVQPRYSTFSTMSMLPRATTMYPFAYVFALPPAPVTCCHRESLHAAVSVHPKET